MPAAPLTAEQRAQMAANKAKAAAVKAAKEKSSMMKQPSMLSFFSPVVKVRHCSASCCTLSLAKPLLWHQCHLCSLRCTQPANRHHALHRLPRPTCAPLRREAAIVTTSLRGGGCWQQSRPNMRACTANVRQSLYGCPHASVAVVCTTAPFPLCSASGVCLPPFSFRPCRSWPLI
jgi:hypothetical protein